MIKIIKKIIQLLNTILYIAFKSNIKLNKTSVLFVKSNITSHNNAYFSKSELKNTIINISGINNLIEVRNTLISQSNISITGNDNKLIVEEGVLLRSATIHIRGSNCTIKIGKGTTFGGIRIVNAGKNNIINIGKNCLFADFIELWASDTHSIYDSDFNFINKERPINIGDNVWIGSHTIILKGVFIGSGSVIGMNTLVTKDIAPKTLNIGNPARCVRENISWSLKYENE